MKLNRNELIVVGVIILYIAFFTHPAPSHITNFLESPIGHIVALLGVAYVLVYQSFVVGLFLGIAYIMTARNVTEYLDETEQKPKEEKKEESKTVTASGIPPPAVTGALKDLLSKGDTRLPQEAGKSKTEKPAETKEPKATQSSELKGKTETFSNF